MDLNTYEFTPVQPQPKRKRTPPPVVDCAFRLQPALLDAGPPSKYTHGHDDYDVTSAKATARATGLALPERLNVGQPDEYGQWHPDFHGPGARMIDGNGDEESSEGMTIGDNSETDASSDKAGDEDSNSSESESDAEEFFEMEDVEFNQEFEPESEYSWESETESDVMSIEPIEFPRPQSPLHTFPPGPHTGQSTIPLGQPPAGVRHQGTHTPPQAFNPLSPQAPVQPLHNVFPPRQSIRTPDHAPLGSGNAARRTPNTQSAAQAASVARSFSLMSIDSVIIENDCEEERSSISERSMSVDRGKSDSEPSGSENTSKVFGDRRLDSAYQKFINNHEEPATKGDLALFMRYMKDPSTPGPSSDHGSQAEPRSRQSESTSSPRKSTVVQHRPVEVLNLQEQVRILVGRALGREEYAPFTSAMVPTKDELDRFSQTGSSDLGPSIPNLRVDVATTKFRSSKWNRHASFLFLRYFQTEIGPDVAADKVVKQTFITHLGTLRRHYLAWVHQQNPKPSETVNRKDKEMLERQDGRRRNLRERRAEVALNTLSDDPSMQRFAEVWDSMPAEAMSGDETDHSSGKLRYVVRKPHWRAAEICSWLSTFDALHLSTRFHSDGRATRGKFPRPRIRNSNRTCRTKSPARGLPRNFYQPQWLASRTEMEMHDLQPTPAIDLSFSPYIERRAKRFHHILEDISKVPLDDDDPTLPEKVAAPLASSPRKQDSTRKKVSSSSRRNRTRPPAPPTTRRTRSYVEDDEDDLYDEDL